MLLFRFNFCKRLPAALVYTSDDAGHSTRKQHLIRTVVPPSLPSRREWDKLLASCVLLPSDTYIATGSGRAIIDGDIQWKGVGRTVHAACHNVHKDAFGGLKLTEAVLEARHTLLLETLLSTPPIPVDSILVAARPRDRVFIETESGEYALSCVLGRRGAPVRLSQLAFLRAALAGAAAPQRLFVWRRFFNTCFGRRGVSVDAQTIESWLLLILESAIRFTCELRVYGISLLYDRGNADLFSRPFDLASCKATFPEVRYDGAHDFPRPRQRDVFRYFDELMGYDVYHQHVSHLKPLAYAIQQLPAVADALGYRLDALHRLVTWRVVLSHYEEGIAQTMARLFGLAGGLDRTSRALLRQLGHAWFPMFVNERRRLPRDWTVLFADFAAGLGASSRHRRRESLAHTLGRRVLGARPSIRELDRIAQRSGALAAALSRLADDQATQVLRERVHREIEVPLRRGARLDYRDRLKALVTPPETAICCCTVIHLPRASSPSWRDDSSL